MNHLRVATFDVLKGTSKEVAEVATNPGGILEIYRSMPGFQAYSILEIDAITVMSITAWETHEEAEAATRAAAEFVATHLEGRIHRTSNQIADSIFWEGVLRP